MAMKSGIPGSLRYEVFKRDNYTCQNCGLVGWPVKNKYGYGHYTQRENVYLSIDHKIPKSRGGEHNKENLTTLCTTCNSKKRTMTMDEFNELGKEKL